MQDKKYDYALEKSDDTLVWSVQSSGDKTVGNVRLDLEETDYIEAPSLSLVVNDPELSEQSAAKAAINTAIKYAYCNLPYQALYSRYDVADKTEEKLYKSLGFETDGKIYKDDDGHEWQNVKVEL